MQEYIIKEIEKKEDKKIEKVIRDCLVEFGANHPGTAWQDPDLCRFSEIYNTPGNRYWVAVNGEGEVIAGVGIGELKGEPEVCELQKMYCVPDMRGKGVSHMLMKKALDYAKEYYSKVYLETLENMTAAHKFYEKYGFYRLDKPLGSTEHFACDVCYIKEL